MVEVVLFWISGNLFVFSFFLFPIAHGGLVLCVM